MSVCAVQAAVSVKPSDGAMGDVMLAAVGTAAGDTGDGADMLLWCSAHDSCDDPIATRIQYFRSESEFQVHARDRSGSNSARTERETAMS